MQEDFSKYNGEGTLLRKAQLRMLDMLTEIDKICKKHAIPYFLDGGTLLGAVRHGGFIPWDDDTDISVLKRDYKKLRKILSKELPEQYVFTDWTTDKYYFEKMGRVKDKKSLFFIPLHRKQKYKGLQVDIFTLSRIPSVKVRNFVNFFFRRIFREIHRFGYTRYDSKKLRLRNICIAYLAAPLVYLTLFACNALSMLNFKKLRAMDFVAGGYGIYEKDLLPLKEIEFEGKMFLCPANADAYLKTMYGDYMQLPPEKDRAPHTAEIIIYE